LPKNKRYICGTNQTSTAMKKIFACSIALFLTMGAPLFAQNTDNMRGVYLSKQGENQVLLLLADGYFSRVEHTENAYKGTIGGPYAYDGEKLTLTVEYDDMSKPAGASVGEKHVYKVSREGDSFVIGNDTFVKQPAKQQALDGLWRITARKQGDNISAIPRGDRKTIKLLVDGHFQWIAINPAEKGFYGTGGGHYAFQNGKYSEHIQFFSRDNSRVGALLAFDGEIKNGDWHHSGLSSKGDPIYEIWSRDAVN